MIPDSDRKTWYSTPRWRALRASVLARSPLCADPFGMHAENRETVIATEVHHVIPRLDRPDLAMDTENLQPLCRDCHDRESAKEKGVEVSVFVLPPYWSTFDLRRWKTNLSFVLDVSELAMQVGAGASRIDLDPIARALWTAGVSYLAKRRRYLSGHVAVVSRTADRWARERECRELLPYHVEDRTPTLAEALAALADGPEAWRSITIDWYAIYNRSSQVNK